MNINNKPQILKAEKIQFKVSGRSTPILHELSLSVYEGEFIIILGHNGSGKSTLIKLLSGNVAPTSGRILIESTPISSISSKLKATDLITLSQASEDRLFLELILAENISLWESRFPKDERLSSEEVIAKTYSSERFLPLLSQKLKDFSGGEKQAILLGLILAHPPRILFLDEHTSALDPKASREIMSMTAKHIEDNKITTVMVTHSLEEAMNYGTRIIIMNEGRIIIDQEKSPSLTLPKLKKMMDL
jgi:putative ABC transport system ATP-binding protein